MIFMIPKVFFKGCFTAVRAKLLFVTSHVTANGFISHTFCLTHFWYEVTIFIAMSAPQTSYQSYKKSLELFLCQF